MPKSKTIPYSIALQLQPTVSEQCEIVGECWEFTGCRTPRGYGRVQDSNGKGYKAHRVVYTLVFGEIPDDMLVCHHCDNPPCLRPHHFFLGTNTDNTEDRHRKGRDATGNQNGSRTHPDKRMRGSQNPIAKLTEAQVKEIRRRYDPKTGIALKHLATEFKVSMTVVSGIVRRKFWKHVD